MENGAIQIIITGKSESILKPIRKKLVKFKKIALKYRISSTGPISWELYENMDLYSKLSAKEYGIHF